MFRSATVKLTLSYLAIIMALCLMFSGAIYQSATNELRHNIDRQAQRLNDQFPDLNFYPMINPQRVYDESRHRLILSLVYLNLAVLIAAGFASYALARWTLRPIEAAHEQQKRFTADVSHELRTPLTALRMTTEVALMDGSASKTELRKTLESNLSDAAKLEMLVNNLLRLTKLEASELQQQFNTVQISEVVDEAIAGLLDKATSKQIKIDSKLAKSLSVSGDHASLVQLLTIFIDNAIKYSPPKTSVIVKGSRDQRNIKLTVTDQGMGIPAADQPRIFDRFYRADLARTSSDEAGFGLGLSIAKMISVIHHGELKIDSTEGQGTTVQILLPSAKA